VKSLRLLKEINEKEVFKYLGIKDMEADDFTKEAVREMTELIFEKAEEKYTFQTFNIIKDEELRLENTVFRLEGNDIKELLKECETCVLMAATLGNKIDAEIRKMQIKDMAKAIILDSCASAAIENVCDNLQHMIEQDFENMFSTDRFSPGYGDMPLESQKILCEVLQTQKKTGIALNSGGLMTPVKSVTAIIGFSKKEQARKNKSCEHCSRYETCSFRKEGITCDRY